MGEPAQFAEELTPRLCQGFRGPCVERLSAHPLPRLRDAGVLCSISTVDPAMFGTDLGREYELAEQLGLPAEDDVRRRSRGRLCAEEVRERLAG